MELEKAVRKYVHDLKGLYINVVVYGVVFIVSVLVWLSFGGAGFWPIWVLLGFAAASLLQGMVMGSIKQLEEVFPFLKAEWEEEQVKKLLKKSGFVKATQQHEAKMSSSEEEKKPATGTKVSKSSVKKPSSKSKKS